MPEVDPNDKPVVAYTVMDASGSPYLLGCRCRVCHSTHLGHYDNCPKCAAIGQLDDIRLPTHGTLYNYTIVYRSLPGVTVPFISAVVDLDGGGAVRGNLLEVTPDPAAIEFGMPIDVVFRSAAEAVADGKGYFSYFFVPAVREAVQ